MEIVFLWIKEYYGIKEQGYNLGSEYIFEVDKREDQHEVTVKENNRFLPKFFQPHRHHNEAKLLNVSAFVGENGSGKSITLDFLREVLKPFPYENDRPPQHIIVFKDNHEDFWYHSTFPVTFDNDQIKKLTERPTRRHDVIYFTPILNPKQTSNIFGDTDDIDISTRHLIYKDWIDYDREAKENNKWDDPIHPYLLKNTQRHSQFLSNFKTLKDLFGGKDIQIAKGIFVSFHFTAKSRMPSKHNELADYDNLPIPLQSALSKIYRFWREERLQDQEQEGRTLNSIRARKRFLLRDFKLAVVLAFAYHMQKNNWYQREIESPGSGDVSESQSFDEAFQYLLQFQIHEPQGQSMDRLKSWESFPILLEHVIDPLVEAYGSVLERPQLEVIPRNVVSDNLVDVSFDDHVALLKQYLIFKKTLTRLNRQKANDFIDFESNKGLSAGEKAYLDLFSRFHVALADITTRIEENHYESDELSLYLLIDEGEIGFHLRWQKEFVKDLCNLLPKVLNIGTHNIQLQVIFTTHSPISLSDLPDTNVTYLKRDIKTGKVQTSADPEKLTFGANIQNLLSNSFFMDEGTIGDFAKRKIESLVKYLKSEEESKYWSQKRADSLISEIGDDILQKRLWDLYSDKFNTRLTLEQEKEILLKRLNEINDLKNRLP